jgi:hypothetical protein
MFTCKSCAHDDMVHVMFVGCCGVRGCPCTGMDGTKNLCREAEHGDACGYWTLRAPRELVTEKEAKLIWSLHLRGSGVRPVAAVSQVKPPLVRSVLAGALWPELVPDGCHRGPDVEPCEHPVDQRLVDATAQRKSDRIYNR